MIKVSVVIPVYNPGEFLRPCVESLLSQTLPATEWEAIFVDDGSTDDTPAYLDQLAAEHANIIAIHQENSGWPGKPRNVGVEVASGEYVFFCDNDDWFGPEALERLYGFATDNHSDVVIGKMAGVNRAVPQGVFRTTKPLATLADTPLMDSLTPHKLFRRAFLLANDIRFPEGKRRLEDHMFVVTAYLKAAVISVYADYVCYYHIRRDDASNAALSRIDWDGYFTNLAEAIEVVVAHTEPGPLRERIYRRWLAVEMVDRLSGSRFRRLQPDEATSIFGAAHDVAARYFSEDTVRRLPPSARPVARAILRGDLDSVARRAELDRHWKVQAVVLQQAWRGSVLQISGFAALTNAAIPGGAGPLGGLVDPGDLSEAAEARASVTLDLTERREGSRWPVPVAAEVRTDVAVAFAADLDPGRLAQGTSLSSGIWDLYADLVVLGLRRRARLSVIGPRSDAKPRLRKLRSGEPEVAAYLTKKDAGVSLDVGLLYHPELRGRSRGDKRRRAPASPVHQSEEPTRRRGLLARLRRRGGSGH